MVITHSSMARDWGSERRLDYIDYRLLTAGTLRRVDISETFGVSESQASQDIARYLDLYPGAVEYDRSAKYYQRAKGYRSQRGLKPTLIEALKIIGQTGHPMGWS